MLIGYSFVSISTYSLYMSPLSLFGFYTFLYFEVNSIIIILIYGPVLYLAFIILRILLIHFHFWSSLNYCLIYTYCMFLDCCLVHFLIRLFTYPFPSSFSTCFPFFVLSFFRYLMYLKLYPFIVPYCSCPCPSVYCHFSCFYVPLLKNIIHTLEYLLTLSLSILHSEISLMYCFCLILFLYFQ